MRKLISFIAATSLLTLASSQSVYIPTNFGNIAIDNSASPTDNQGLITFPTTNIFANQANDLSHLSLDLPSIQLNNPTENTTPPTNTEESSSPTETTTELIPPPTVEENGEFEEDLTELPPVVVVENENNPVVPPNEFDLEGLPIIPEESGDIITNVAENNDLSSLLGNTLENSVAAAAAPASTVKCEFNEVGQLQCQTCYYQAGCFGIDCPIDHCE